MCMDSVKVEKGKLRVTHASLGKEEDYASSTTTSLMLGAPTLGDEADLDMKAGDPP